MKLFTVAVSIILFLGIEAKSTVHKYENGKAVYDVQLTRPSDANGKKFSFLSQLLKEASFEYSIYFSPSTSLSGSSSDLIFSNDKFSWGGNVTIRKNELSNEIWKRYGQKMYYMMEKQVSVFKKYTGNKKIITGFNALECTYTNHYGQEETGWVTKDLPKTAGMSLLQGCDFALIAFQTEVSKVTLKSIEAVQTNWAAVWQTKPAKQLRVIQTELSQYILYKKIAVDEPFPDCRMITTQGKKVTDDSLKERKTLFFFSDPFGAEPGFGDINLTPNSRDERYIKTISKKLGTSAVQIYVIVPHYTSEINYLLSVVAGLKGINLVADPFNKIFGNLHITDYPFGILVNSKSNVEWADTCFSDDEVQAMITKALKQ